LSSGVPEGLVVLASHVTPTFTS